MEPERLPVRVVATSTTVARLAASVVVGVLLAVGVALPAKADSIRDREYWLDDYGITDAWATTRGEGTTIAIIDTGVDGSHPDLRGAVTGGADFSGAGSADGQSPVGAEGSSHGTMVAGLAAGRGRGDSGVRGVAPAASILSVSVGFDSGTSSDDQIALAVRWAVDNGADVINMSLTRNTLDWPRSWDDAFLYAAERDVVVVAAAGNRGSGTTQVGAPATMPGVLTVAGLDRAGRASTTASAQGITIGVAAPAEELVGVVPGGGYVLWNGTSGATPIVAGIAALVRAEHPELDAANVINRIVSTARDAGRDGNDPIYGFGVVDAAAAVSANVAPVSANPMGDLASWVRVNRPSGDAQGASTPVPLPPETRPEARPEAANREPATAPISVMQSRNLVIPLAVFAALAGLVALVVAALRLHFRRARPRG